MIEAGPTLGAAFFQAGLVDEILFYQAPTILGSNQRFTQGLDFTSIAEQIRLLDRGIEIFNGDIKRTLFADNEINRRLTCSPV
jgi:diaminohydroxyphosphoribosylaminopyrimidine deaminase/5-amino-6-(5-phosphoribosylamino)uracil reductase